jgi:hypothetical protein
VPRKILVTNGDHHVQLVERAADNEYELQTVLLNHPGLVPAEDLGLDDDLLVVGRETMLASGSVDLLCLSKSGEVVIIEFKTGPQNPDFRHALAQVIDYGSDLWKLNGWSEFDEGVVHRFLAGRYVDPGSKSTDGLRDAARRAWGLDDQGWEALALRLDQVLDTGDFHFVVAAQRFTEQMKDSVRYLNGTTRYGKYFLIELIRLDGTSQKAYAAQVVEKPSARSAGTATAARATEADFLAAIGDPDYREAMSQLFSTVSALGLVLAWYSKGASIRLKSPDRTEPISIGWVFLEGGQWYTAKHVTFGVDPATRANHPTIAGAISTFCQNLGEIAGGKPAGGSLDAVVFEPTVFPDVKAQVFDLLAALKSDAGAAVGLPWGERDDHG